MIYDIGRAIEKKHYEVLKERDVYDRQVMLFALTLQELPVEIRPEDRIAGWYGYAEGTVFPQGDGAAFPYHAVLSGEQRRQRVLLSRYLTDINFTPAHTCIDYGGILRNGLEHYVLQVEKELETHPGDLCLAAMRSSLQAAGILADRFAAAAKEMLAKTTDAAQKLRLEKMYDALCRVPRKSARTFLEAVQAVWLLHTLTPVSERSWASISLGRMDQYLYPYYEKHLAQGGTAEEAKAILKNLFILLDSYGDGACALNVGGADAQGKDMCNALTRLLLEVEKECALRAPIFAVRVTPEMPSELMEKLIDFDLFKIGQPTFYGEMNCRRAVRDRGAAEADAVDFSVNSCMGLMCPGKEFADMWGIRFNAHLPLELTVNSGLPLEGQDDLSFCVAPVQPESFEVLFEQFGRYTEAMLTACAKLHDAVSMEYAANTPNPFVSALTDGCVQNRQDRAMGARYNTVTVETMGVINTCDALLAIRELVFEQKKYTLAEFVAAAKADYCGHEKLRRDILKCKKYGMNDAQADALCRRVCDMVYRVCKAGCHDNRYYLPSLHTIDVNVGYGGMMGATLDGRRSGEPVNKNANPSHLLCAPVHTGVILSAAALDQYKFSGGQPIDLFFDRAWFETKESREKIRHLILTYFGQGGLQFQVNSVDIELLEKAHLAPEQYPQVVVRKGGYSVRFNELPAETRESFIAAYRELH